MSENSPESELNIPLEIKGRTDWKRTNVINKFCWQCFHQWKHGVYSPTFRDEWDTMHICSVCGHTIKK